jgi:hypothetical protein
MFADFRFLIMGVYVYRFEVLRLLLIVGLLHLLKYVFLNVSFFVDSQIFTVIFTILFYVCFRDFCSSDLKEDVCERSDSK